MEFRKNDPQLRVELGGKPQEKKKMPNLKSRI